MARAGSMVLAIAILLGGCNGLVNAEDIRATTSDGRTVVLRSDKTWEFVESNDKDEDPASQYEEGREAILRGDFRVAYDLLQPLGDQGHAKAQNALGVLYGKDGWAGKDDGQAMRWFRKAADQGNPQAMFNLGVRYERVGDELEAERWYLMAADKGLSQAARRLGVMFERAGMIGNAGKWYRKAREMEEREQR